MFYKRPITSFLGAFIVGIIVASNNIPILFKLFIALIAIFLYLRLLFINKLTIRALLLILTFILLGFARFRIVEKKFNDYENSVVSLGKGSKVFSGKVITIGKSTNSNYIILENTISNGLELGKCRCYLSDDLIKNNIKIGNTIKIKGSVFAIKDVSNEGEFNQKTYYRSDNITFLIFAKEIEIINTNYNKILQGIYDTKKIIKKQIQTIFNYKDAGLFSAMLTGDKSTIDKEQKKIFSDNGIAHILAISGLHLSILGLFLFELLRKRFSVCFSSYIVSIFILFYGIFIDAGPSSLRAIIMLYVRFLSLSIGKTYDSKNTLFIICLIFLIINPYLLYNAGFQFSYLAIYALNTDVVIIRKKISYNDKLIKIPQVLVLTLFLFPITIYHYFTYPLYSIFINLIVIPLMSFVLGFGISGLLVSFLCVSLGKIVVLVVHYIFFIYDFLCNLVTKLPYHILWVGRPTLYEMLFYYVALFLIIYAINDSTKCFNRINYIKYEDDRKHNKVISFFDRRFRVIMCMVLLICSVIIIGIRKRSIFRLTFLDVGQGDGAIVESMNLFITIDGGASSNSSMGEYLLVPHLKSRAIKEIEYSFVSHSDSDHINGILHLLQNEDEVSIKNLVLPINAKTDNSFSKLKAAASSRGTKVLYLEEGNSFNINTCDKDIIIDTLSPSSTFINEKKVDVNEKSLTFRMEYDDKSVLFTGDIGKKAINSIISNDNVNNKLNVDVLKVPHHGSKNSNVKEFIEKVNPKYSVISYQAGNSYGHPHKITLDTLLESGTEVLKTAVKGQIDIYFDEGIYEKSFK